MATPDKLLSTKTQEKPEEIDANTEDGTVTEVGGPEADWSTADYANFSFDAADGVKPDKTILSKASVKAEAPETISEEGEEDDEEKLTEEIPVVTEMEDDGEEFSIEESDDEEKAEKAEEPAEDAVADDTDGDEDTMELSLKDLVDEGDDTELIELDTTPDDDQDLLKVEADADAGEDESLPIEETDEFADLFKTEADEEPVEDEAPVEDVPAEDEKLDEEADEEAKDDDEAKGDKKEVAAESKKLRIRFDVKGANRLFENNTTLSAEDRRQGRVLFESAVRQVAGSIGQQLYEAYRTRYRRAVNLHEKKMAAQVDRYLSYAVEQWMAANKVPLQNELRTRLNENFMRGLKNLFAEHYVDVPASKVDVVEALAKSVKSLKKQLAESEGRAVKMHRTLKESVQRERKAAIKEHKARLIAEAASSVVAADRGEFVRRAATVKFAGTRAFKSDLVALKEQYFGARSSKPGRSMTMPDAAPLFEEKSSRTPRTVVDAAVAVLDRSSRDQ